MKCIYRPHTYRPNIYKRTEIENEMCFVMCFCILESNDSAKSHNFNTNKNNNNHANIIRNERHTQAQRKESKIPIIPIKSKIISKRCIAFTFCVCVCASSLVSNGIYFRFDLNIMVCTCVYGSFLCDERANIFYILIHTNTHIHNGTPTTHAD